MNVNFEDCTEILIQVPVKETIEISPTPTTAFFFSVASDHGALEL